MFEILSFFRALIISLLLEVIIADALDLSNLFLDDKNIQEVENKLNTKIHVLDDSNDIINTLIG